MGANPGAAVGGRTALVCVLVAAACTAGAGTEASDRSTGTTATDAGQMRAPSRLDASMWPPSEGRREPRTIHVCAEPASELPNDVFCTGLYEDGDATQLSAGAMPYTPGLTFWSDGAEKRRYLYLPPGAKIDSSNMDSWKFPIGTKAWKEFRIEGRLIETRLFWKRAESDWVSATYVWDGAGVAATLNTSRTPVVLGDGYEIPTNKDCGKCHHGGADKLLGIEAVALALPSAQGVTLKQLASTGALTRVPAQTIVALPEDSTGKAARALGYLHVNCGMPCHSTRGLGEETKLVLRLRADELWPTATGQDGGASSAPANVEQTDIYRAALGVEPTTAAVAQRFPGAARITPGNHEQSLLWLLAHVRGDYQMPPLVSHKVDEAGTRSLAEWIDALER